LSFSRWGYDFDGAYADPQDLKPQAGVYIVWCDSGEAWEALDLGESEDVRSRLVNHERGNCWRENCKGTLRYAAAYTPGVSEEGRRRIEEYLRQIEKPLCGPKEASQ
jgi:hypothetical protein